MQQTKAQHEAQQPVGVPCNKSASHSRGASDRIRCASCYARNNPQQIRNRPIHPPKMAIFHFIYSHFIYRRRENFSLYKNLTLYIATLHMRHFNMRIPNFIYRRHDFVLMTFMLLHRLARCNGNLLRLDSFYSYAFQLSVR